jgi:hypothetical protein
VPPLVGIGLTEVPNSGGAKVPPAPPLTTALPKYIKSGHKTLYMVSSHQPLLSTLNALNHRSVITIELHKRGGAQNTEIHFVVQETK